MAIKDGIDFDYAIKQIINKTNPQIIEQSKILESEKMNKTFEEIEATLNTLYEKTRYIEDAIEYAQIFIDTKIRDFDAEMTSVIKEIEDVADMTKNTAYLSYNVPLKENLVAINDNNGDYLAPLLNKDDKLVLGTSDEITWDFSTITRQSDSIPFDDNLNTVFDSRKYRCIYLEEKIAPDGLREVITVHFERPRTINLLDFKKSNCLVYDVRFGLINGYEESVVNFDDLDRTNRTCQYIKFEIKCETYDTITYEIDKNKISENLWGDLKQFEKARLSAQCVNKLNTEYVISRTVTSGATGEKTTNRYSSTEGKDTISITMYAYIFGLDQIEFKQVSNTTDGYFLSEPINIGELGEKEYINIYTKQSVDANCSIEYSIIDGEREIPILRVNDDLVENEYIYSNSPTRFVRCFDDTKPGYIPEIVKKDGLAINDSFDSVTGLQDLDGRYSITYKPLKNCYDYTPLNPDIRIKAYVRTYIKNAKTSPFIEMISIRKYGEDTVWINKF